MSNELVYTTRKVEQLTKEQIKKLKQAKKEAIESGKIVRK